MLLMSMHSTSHIFLRQLSQTQVNLNVLLPYKQQQTTQYTIKQWNISSLIHTAPQSVMVCRRPVLKEAD